MPGTQSIERLLISVNLDLTHWKKVFANGHLDRSLEAEPQTHICLSASPDECATVVAETLIEQFLPRVAHLLPQDELRDQIRLIHDDFRQELQCNVNFWQHPTRIICADDMEDHLTRFQFLCEHQLLSIESRHLAPTLQKLEVSTHIPKCYVLFKCSEQVKVDPRHIKSPSDAEEVFALLRDGSYDVLVTDVFFVNPNTRDLKAYLAEEEPGGLALAKKAVANCPRLAVLCLSQVADHPDFVAWVSKDCLAYGLTPPKLKPRAALSIQGLQFCNELKTRVAHARSAMNPRRARVRTQGTMPGRPSAVELGKLRAKRDKNCIVSIFGENGTGKTTVARDIHDLCNDSGNAKLESVQCHTGATVELFKSQLFGYTKGAFTGADSDTPGAYARADGGTVVLNDIHLLSPECQGLLIPVTEVKLDARGYRPLMGGQDAQCRARTILTIVGSPSMIWQWVEDGRFSRDLSHRMSQGIIMELPAVRERPEKIPTLIAEVWEGLFHEPFNWRRVPEEVRQLLINDRWGSNMRGIEGWVMCTKRDRDIGILRFDDPVTWPKPIDFCSPGGSPPVERRVSEIACQCPCLTNAFANDAYMPFVREFLGGDVLGLVHRVVRSIGTDKETGSLFEVSAPDVLKHLEDVLVNLIICGCLATGKADPFRQVVRTLPGNHRNKKDAKQDMAGKWKEWRANMCKGDTNQNCPLLQKLKGVSP